MARVGTVYALGAALSLTAGLVIVAFVPETHAHGSVAAKRVPLTLSGMTLPLLGGWIMAWRSMEDPLLALYVQGLCAPGAPWTMWTGVAQHAPPERRGEAVAYAASGIRIGACLGNAMAGGGWRPSAWAGSSWSWVRVCSRPFPRSPSFLHRGRPVRKRFYHWHVALGRLTGVLLVIWAASGLVTVIEPMLAPLFEKPLPKMQVPRVDPALLALPPLRAIGDGVSPNAITARTWKSRGWYEVTNADGTTVGFDATTGQPVDPFLTSVEVREMLMVALSGSAWAVRALERLDDFDDHYRKGPLPVYRVGLDGPCGYVVYVDARCGNVEKKTTTLARLLRWAGLGLHAWNLQAFRKTWDTWRRGALALGVAVPLLLMAVLSVGLLRMRDQQARRPRRLETQLQAVVPESSATAPVE